MRSESARLVDKTGAIADLLCSESMKTRRAFFARPRKFGKSLTLEIMAALLRAGDLPLSVKPWRGYEQVDTDRLFRGLVVHSRLQQEHVLRTAHFVVHLDLSRETRGSVLENSIRDQLAKIGRKAFGDQAWTEIRESATPGDALDWLLSYVPKGVRRRHRARREQAAVGRGRSGHRGAAVAACDEQVARRKH